MRSQGVTILKRYCDLGIHEAGNLEFTVWQVPCMVSAAKSATFGVHFLMEAVEPTVPMIELRKAGVKRWEILELCD